MQEVFVVDGETKRDVETQLKSVKRALDKMLQRQQRHQNGNLSPTEGPGAHESTASTHTTPAVVSFGELVRVNVAIRMFASTP